MRALSTSFPRVLLAATLSFGFGGPGVTEATAEDTCRARFPVIRDGHELALIHCINRVPDSVDPAVERIVFVLHGKKRNPEEYYGHVMEAASEADEDASVIIVPAFLTHEDLRERSLGDDVLYWSDQGWKQGDLSRAEPAARPFRVSSFEALDDMITHFADLERFPNLREIVVAGHSAGGQYSQRHAALSPTGSHLAGSGVSLRHVVANPSSYLYLDGARRTQRDPDRFQSPSNDERSDCPGYNHYKYGLKHPNAYAGRAGQATPGRYGGKLVGYLIGSRDDQVDESLDTTCPANLQGKHRLARAQTYRDYLAHYYGEDVAANHRFTFVPGVGHDAREMLTSEEGRAALFGMH